MWKDAEAAALTADPKHPRLDDHAEAGALALLEHVMSGAHEAGVTIKGSVVVDPHVTKSSRTKVELRDCIDGSHWVQAKPGSSASTGGGGHRLAEATVTRTSDGQWRVSDLYWEDVGTCLE